MAANDLFIRIGKREGGGAPYYTCAHDGIERTGLSATEVLVKVVQILELPETIGKVVRKEIVRERWKAAQEREQAAKDECLRLKAEYEALGGSNG